MHQYLPIAQVRFGKLRSCDTVVSMSYCLVSVWMSYCLVSVWMSYCLVSVGMSYCKVYVLCKITEQPSERVLMKGLLS